VATVVVARLSTCCQCTHARGLTVRRMRAPFAPKGPRLGHAFWLTKDCFWRKAQSSIANNYPKGTMKAMTYRGPYKARIEEKDNPGTTARLVLIAMTWRHDRGLGCSRLARYGRTEGACRLEHDAISGRTLRTERGSHGTSLTPMDDARRVRDRPASQNDRTDLTKSQRGHTIWLNLTGRAMRPFSVPAGRCGCDCQIPR
jgi:hypothetical protein